MKKINESILRFFQKHGLKPPTLSDEVSSYAMLLVMILTISGFFLLRPAYVKLRDTQKQLNTIQRAVAANERAIASSLRVEQELSQNKQTLADKQQEFITTQVESDILRVFVNTLYDFALSPLSLSVTKQPVSVQSAKTANTADTNDPFVYFQTHVQTSGSLNSMLIFIQHLYDSESFVIENATLRRQDEHENPYSSTFNGNFTIRVYSVTPNE